MCSYPLLRCDVIRQDKSADELPETICHEGRSFLSRLRGLRSSLLGLVGDFALMMDGLVQSEVEGDSISMMYLETLRQTIGLGILLPDDISRLVGLHSTSCLRSASSSLRYA
nr:hypothetical protein CFP56_57913 [Quercus suber]